MSNWEESRLEIVGMFEAQCERIRHRIRELEEEAAFLGSAVDLTPHRALLESLEDRIARIRNRKRPVMIQ